MRRSNQKDSLHPCCRGRLSDTDNFLRDRVYSANNKAQKTVTQFLLAARVESKSIQEQTEMLGQRTEG
jgi:hypothetical protein